MKNKYIVLIVIAVAAVLFSLAILTGLVHVNLKGWRDIAIAVVIVIFIVWRIIVMNSGR
jgi:hypothetical protein